MVSKRFWHWKKRPKRSKKGTNGKYISILSGIALINGTKCHLYEVTVDFEDYRNEERHLIALSWPCKAVCCTFCQVGRGSLNFSTWNEFRQKCYFYEVTVDFEDYRNEERHLVALRWPCKAVCCIFCPVGRGSLNFSWQYWNKL